MASGGGVIASREVGVREFGRVVEVADNPKAKLMYYLDCVATALQLDRNDVRRLRDYSKHDQLTEEETDVLLTLVLLFSPDELIGKVFFNSDELCDNAMNKFYELNQVTSLLAVSQSVLVGGKQTRVAKIMAFREYWLHESYIQPIKHYESRLLRMALGMPRSTDRQVTQSNVTRRPGPPQPRAADSSQLVVSQNRRPPTANRQRNEDGDNSRCLIM